MSNDSKVASSGSDREDCLIAGDSAGSSLGVATEVACVRVWFILLRGRCPPARRGTVRSPRIPKLLEGRARNTSVDSCRTTRMVSVGEEAV